MKKSCFWPLESMAVLNLPFRYPKCGWNSSFRTFKSLKRQISLVSTFPSVTISWIKAVKAYDVSFYGTKIFLDQSKKFGLVQNVQVMDQITKFSSEKLFSVRSKTSLNPNKTIWTGLKSHRRTRHYSIEYFESQLETL